MQENENVLGPDADEMSPEELEAATAPEVDENDVMNGTKADDMPAEENPVEVEKEPVAKQGNTDPRDFAIFDENGHYVEKRDR